MTALSLFLSLLCCFIYRNKRQSLSNVSKVTLLGSNGASIQGPSATLTPTRTQEIDTNRRSFLIPPCCLFFFFLNRWWIALEKAEVQIAVANILEDSLRPSVTFLYFYCNLKFVSELGTGLGFPPSPHLPNFSPSSQPAQPSELPIQVFLHSFPSSQVSVLLLPTQAPV